MTTSRRRRDGHNTAFHVAEQSVDDATLRRSRTPRASGSGCDPNKRRASRVVNLAGNRPVVRRPISYLALPSRVMNFFGPAPIQRTIARVSDD